MCEIDLEAENHERAERKNNFAAWKIKCFVLLCLQAKHEDTFIGYKAI
jgi:hypothetical protein